LVNATLRQSDSQSLHQAKPGNDNFQDTDDLEKDLAELARRLIAIVLQPQLLQLRRLVIAEARRFPDLGRTYYERGPGRTVATLASRFQQLAERGRLRLEDPLLAANHFNWLVLSIPLNETMLTGDDERFTPADLERLAQAAVRVFLAAYGQPDPARSFATLDQQR
jgi:TetR/AcrR family transcriptional repressor of mexJK operon